MSPGNAGMAASFDNDWRQDYDWDMSRRSEHGLNRTDKDSTSTGNETAGRVSERAVLILVSACIFMAVLNTNMFNVALPAIQEDFNVGAGRIGWIVTAYSLVFGVAVLFYGRLGDRYGLRRLFIIGLAVFATGSFAALFAPNFWLLIAARVVQATGVAAIPSLGTASIIRIFPPERRGYATGYTSAVVGVGAAIGPTLGGVVTQFTSWRGLFLISALIGLAIPFVVRILPRDHPSREGSLDLLGGTFLAGAVVLLMLTVTMVQSIGLSLIVAGTVALAALLILLLALRIRAVAQPFIDPALLRDRNYVLLASAAFLIMLGNVGNLVLIPLLLDRINDLPAGQIGLVLLPPAILMGLFAPVGGRLADRYGSWLPMRFGMGLFVTGLFLLSSFGVGSPVLVVTAFLLLTGAGMGFSNSTLISSMSLILPPRLVGLGIGLFNMLFFVGGAFGAAIVTGILAAREDATDALNPLHDGLGAAFSDALLATLIAAIAAFTIAWLVAIPRARRQAAPARGRPATRADYPATPDD